MLSVIINCLILYIYNVQIYHGSVAQNDDITRDTVIQIRCSAADTTTRFDNIPYNDKVGI